MSDGNEIGKKWKEKGFCHILFRLKDEKEVEDKKIIIEVKYSRKKCEGS